MKELTLTDSEYAELIHAVEVYNDMLTDMICDLESIDYNHITDSVTVNKDDYKNLLIEITNKANQLASIRTLMLKLNLEVNDKGYSK